MELHDSASAAWISPHRWRHPMQDILLKQANIEKPRVYTTVWEEENM